VAVWDKKNSRPQPGYYRQQCEFMVWGTKGDTADSRKNIYLPGIFSHTNPNTAARFHQTQKSLELMREVIKIAEPGGTILDPFAGSGTTCLAAKLEGYSYIGVEISEHFAAVARDRLGGEI
jgi:site-specific DNA-methyltransferase (adenine-specific)